MSIGQTMLTPSSEASYIIFMILHYRSEACGLRSQGFHIHIVACNFGLFEIFVPTGQQHDIWLLGCIVYLCRNCT